MRKYKVYLKLADGLTTPFIVSVRADDVNVETCEDCPETAFWNFVTDDVTVAAFRFPVVDYVLSEDGL